jgi:hypothetical protein
MSFRVHSSPPGLSRPPSLIRVASVDNRPMVIPQPTTMVPPPFVPNPTIGPNGEPEENPRPIETVIQSNLFQDVHQYDYSYKDLPYTPVVKTLEERKRLILELEDKVTNPSARLGIHLIYANAGTMNNLDNTNGKQAEDLLADLAHAILVENQIDILPLLEEQMADMFHLGQCAQGKTTRLWQLIQVLDKKEEQKNEETE